MNFYVSWLIYSTNSIWIDWFYLECVHFDGWIWSVEDVTENLDFVELSHGPETKKKRNKINVNDFKTVPRQVMTRKLSLYKLLRLRDVTQRSAITILENYYSTNVVDTGRITIFPFNFSLHHLDIFVRDCPYSHPPMYPLCRRKNIVQIAKPWNLKSNCLSSVISS